MMLRKSLPIVFFLVFHCFLQSQEIPVTYTLGENYNDRYKYSNLLTISEDGTDGYILVRSYYTGILLRPKGYFIEHYNKNMELISEYNYKLKNVDFVEGVIRNGQIYLLFLNYNLVSGTYDYVVHRSPISGFNFTKETILSITSDLVSNPLEKNYYNRNFSSGFTTTVLSDDNKSAFVISTHFKKGKNNSHMIYVYDGSFKKIMEHDFSEHIEDKNYAFENMAVSKGLDKAYIIGKAYFKKKRFSSTERKFQYELIQISKGGGNTQSFDSPGKFSEALKPILVDDRLICIGFYADRKDNRYNGLGYFDMDPNTLAIRTKKYNPFSQQFMLDKFGREEDKEIKNLVFKDVRVTDDKAILFNAEEYFVTTNFQQNAAGSRLRIDRYHYNDIVSAKLSKSGDMVWARNINKTEVTQGDAAYASYSTYTKGDNSYFFISTSSENPQQLSDERISFKQGFSRNRNVFVIQLDSNGHMSYEKIIDDKEARLPLMVSYPLIDADEDKILFYAKRGSKKQLVKVMVN